MIINKNHIYILLLPLFFLLGSNLFFLSLIFCSLYIVISVKFLDKINIKQIVFYLFTLLFLIFFYFSNHEYITNYDVAMKILIYFLLSFMVFLCVSSSFYSEDLMEKIIFSFFLGACFRVFITVVYSYFTSDKYGYGLIFDPLRGYETNSPGYSNTLIIPTCFFIYCFSKRYFKIISIIIVIFSFCSAVFLGGRFFFVGIVIFSISSLFFLNGTRKVHFLMIFISILLIILFYFNGNEMIHFLIERFLSGGSNSNRISHLKDGFNLLLEHPLGSFFVPTSVESTHWFHNIYLDVGKVGGILLVLCLILINLYSFVNLFLFNNRVWFLLSIISILVMGQDVILEGNYNIFLSYIFISSVPFFLKYQYK